MSAHALVLAALCVLALHTQAHCPRLCDCKWKGGKESVLCPGANLTRLPSRLDAGTQLLDLTDNPITTIPRDAFMAAGLLNLQKIYVAKCRLKTIDRFAFRKLINLIELDLSYNSLSTVPSHVFDSTPELRELKLSGNPIQRVSNEAFVYVPQLVRLEISDCRLGTVEPRAFSGLEQTLEWLKLDRNKLSDVKSSTLTSLKSLHGLELSNNPWNCTCGLRPLRDWMLKKNVPFGLPPTCRFPARLAGRSWERMELDEFACAPEIKPAETESTAEEGDNVTLTCHIEGEPTPRVLWLLRNKIITNTSSGSGRRTYFVRAKGSLASLTLVAADLQDAGLYTCAAENVAGKAEAVVKLAVAKREGGKAGGSFALAAGATIAILILMICLLVFGIKAARNKPRPHQAACNRHRADSYEKIEMNHKMNHVSLANAIDNESANHRNEAVTAMMGAMRKRGDYRNVPSQDTEDEAETYDEDMETPTPSSEVQGAGAWRGMPQPTWPAPREPSKPDETDLHIPRLSEYREPRIALTPESISSCSQVFSTYACSESQNKVNNNINDMMPPSHHMRRQLLHSSTARVYTPSNPPHSNNTDEQNNFTSEGEKNYPDLLEINSMNANPTDNLDQSLPAYSNEEKRDNYFYTLPRKGGANMRNQNGRYQRDSESSQSPLLPESRYGSSGGESSLGSNSNRRLSIESYSHYALSNGNTKPGQRSNSFLNLASATVVRGAPSLPGSPVSATPLLEIRGLSRAEMSRAPIAVANTSMPLTYDYHAAQLERFLEEYRSLQEQLCKMKETCENMSESRNRGSTSRTFSNNCGVTLSTSEESDPRALLKHKPSVAVTATSGSAAGGTSLSDATSPISINPGDHSLGMPAWNTASMMKRLGSNGEFFRS